VDEIAGRLSSYLRRVFAVYKLEKVMEIIKVLATCILK